MRSLLCQRLQRSTLYTDNYYYPLCSATTVTRFPHSCVQQYHQRHPRYVSSPSSYEIIVMLLFRMSRSTYKSSKPPFRVVTRHFTLQNVAAAGQMPPRLVLREEDIEEAFLKGSGPGGQKIVRRLFYATHMLRLCRLTVFNPVRTRRRLPSN